MAFCPSCGAQAEGRFCPKCGAALAADTGGGAVPPPASVQSSGMTDNMAAALCYLLFCIPGGVLFLVLEPYNKNKFIRFHAFQAIFFGIALIAISIVASILGLAFLAVPVIRLLFGSLLHLVIWLGSLVVWLLLMYKAYNNEKFVLPIIGPLAEKQA